MAAAVAVAVVVRLQAPVAFSGKMAIQPPKWLLVAARGLRAVALKRHFLPQGRQVVTRAVLVLAVLALLLQVARGLQALLQSISPPHPRFRYKRLSAPPVGLSRGTSSRFKF